MLNLRIKMIEKNLTGKRRTPIFAVPKKGV